MYYLIFLFFLILSIAESRWKKSYSLFCYAYILLSLLVVFRYGQGTDYFNYKSYYDEIIYYQDNIAAAFLIRGDWGYVCLNYLFVRLGIKYEYLMMFVAILTMGFFYPFFKTICSRSIISLFTFYCTIFMIYPFSSVRQGLSMAIFYGMMYPLLDGKVKIKYFVWGIFAFLFHASSIIFLLFPFLREIKITRNTKLIFLVSCIILLVGSTFLSHIPIGFIQSRMEYYFDTGESSSVLPKLLRLCIVIPLFFGGRNANDDLLMRSRYFIIIGFSLYAITSFNELVSGRLWAYFLGFFCIYLSRLRYSRNNKRYFQLFFYCFLFAFLWIKDINAAIEQGSYRYCNIMTYPYISIFDGEETLHYYRSDLGYESN